MKRTNLVLHAQLLEEATALSGERTFSRTVERALAEMVNRLKARRLVDLAGSGIWSGNLAVIRGDDRNASSPTSTSLADSVRERPPVYRPRARTPRGKK